MYYLLYISCRSSVVERVLGKDEVGSSILPDSTIEKWLENVRAIHATGENFGNPDKSKRKPLAGSAVAKSYSCTSKEENGL